MVIEQLSEKKGKKHATDNWEHKATLKEVFLDVGCKCHTVICSRVTPGQKAGQFPFTTPQLIFLHVVEIFFQKTAKICDNSIVITKFIKAKLLMLKRMT